MVRVVLVHEGGEVRGDLAESPGSLEALDSALLPRLLLALIHALKVRFEAHFEIAVSLCFL